MINSRKIEDLCPECAEKFYAFRAAMIAAGIHFIVTSTYRDQEQQDALYAQGRTAPGPIVTWVKHSKHQDRKAFDIAITVDGKIMWSVKVDCDQDQVPDYLEAAELGQNVGLTPGGLWQHPDFPHYEVA